MAKSRVRCGIFDVVVAGAESLRMRAGGAADGEPQDFAVRDRGRRARPQSLDPYPRGFGKLVPNPDINWGYGPSRSRTRRPQRHWPRRQGRADRAPSTGWCSCAGAQRLRRVASGSVRRLGGRGCAALFQADGTCVNGADEWRGTGGPSASPTSGGPRRWRRPSRGLRRLRTSRASWISTARIDGVGLHRSTSAMAGAARPAVGYSPAEPLPEQPGIVTDAMCGRPIRGPSRVGVEVARDEKIQRIGARRELILSRRRHRLAGTAAGLRHRPRRRAGAAGVEVKLDLAGVGKNLQDHYRADFYVPNGRAADTLDEAHDKSGQIGEDRRSQWLFARNRPARRPHHRSDAVCQVEPERRARAGYPVQLLNFSSDSLDSGLHGWPGFPPSIFSVCRAEEPRRNHARATPRRMPATHPRQPPDRPRRHAHACWRDPASAAQIAATEPRPFAGGREHHPAKSGVETTGSSRDFVRSMGSTVDRPTAPAGWTRMASARHRELGYAFTASRPCTWWTPP